MSDKKGHPFLTNVSDSPFKDHRNQWLTRALFYEFKTSGITPMYTIKEHDYKDYKSLKKIYLDYPHVPGYEYDFAEKHLGGWEHWTKLQTSTVLKPIIKGWQEELAVKQKCNAIREIISISKMETGNSLAAAKFLVEKGYAPKEENKRGRPSKEEKEARLKEDTAVLEELDEDMQRLGIINGGRS